ncbi:hypothetical protein ACPB9J_33245 [Streptomyces lavendulocolor]|uniref:hypothetical protein n=1 Tax=Streptomyces lavendulocolor TaxID=67316 RepID=UPI003C2C07C6
MPVRNVYLDSEFLPADPTNADLVSIGLTDVFTPGADDMTGTYAGVLVAELGEGERVIALTGDKTLALEAIDTYYRVECGFPNLLDDHTADLTTAYYFLDSGHAVFTRTGDGGWTATPTGSDSPGAVPVTRFNADEVTLPVRAPYTQADSARIF